MRKLVLLILLQAAALHALAASEVIAQVSVEELEKTVARNHGKPDDNVARQLSGLALTERLTATRLASLNAALPGEESRRALTALADAAAFLDLPASEIPVTPALDRAAQQALLEKAAAYVKRAIPELPDFFATQQTTRFSDGPLKTSRLTGASSYSKKLRVVDQSTATVRFLGGKEELTDGQAAGQARLPAGPHLAVEGVFGPILKIVLKDVLAGTPLWGHWERGTAGPMAVFRFDVPQEKSHFFVGGPGRSPFLPRDAAFHGEIGLDPQTGAILRLTLRATPQSGSGVARADILVEYGAVDIGGQTHICPLRSVALSLAGAADLWQTVYGFSQPVDPPPPSPLRLEVNDIAYSHYHLFRTEMRLLPEDSSGAGAATIPPGIHPAPPAAVDDAAEPNGNQPSALPAPASSTAPNR